MRLQLFLMAVFLFITACQNEPKSKALDPKLVELFGPGYDTVLREPIFPDTTLGHNPHYKISTDSFEFSLRDFPNNKGLLQLEWEKLDSIDVHITEYTSLCKCLTLDYKKEIKELTQPNLINITFDPRKWDKGEHKYLFIYTSGFPYKHKIKVKRNL